MRNPFAGVFGRKPQAEPTPTAAAEAPVSEPERPKRNPADHLASYRWKPGESGNPNGRPKGRSITAHLRDALADLDAEGQEAAQAIARVLVTLAAGGDVAAAKVVLERTEGRVAQPIEHGGNVALCQTVFFIPDNGRDDRAQGSEAAAGASDSVPGDPG